MTLEDQILQVLQNQQTIIGNQQTIINNQATALTAIQGIPGANTSAITTALAQIEGQASDIDTQITAITAQLQPSPSPTPTPTPVPTPAPGS
jgi:hypothetical protein